MEPGLEVVLADPVSIIVGVVVSVVLTLLIDFVILPAIFPEEDVEGPRVDQLQGFTADEGAPVNRCFGPENRVFGHAMWASPLREVAVKKKFGGGLFGIGEGTITIYQYFIDLAIAWCEGETSSGGTAIDSVEKVWLADRAVYDVFTTLAVTGATDLSVETFSNTAGTFMRITAPVSGTDLSIFRPGPSATTSGFSSGVNNGSFPVVSSGGTVATGTNVVLQNANAVAEAAGATASVSEGIPSAAPGFTGTIAHYEGDIGQTPDVTIQSAESGPVPGYSGIAYTVVTNVDLSFYGNRVPPPSAQINADPAPYPVRDAVSTICQMAGLTPDEIDVSAIPSTLLLRGFTTRGPIEAEKMLQQLALGFSFTNQERDGKLFFFLRENAVEIAVDPNDLTARVPGSDEGSDRLVRISDSRVEESPRMVAVSYLDPAADYQRAAQPATAINLRAESKHIQRVSLPIVLSATEATEFAFRFLWTAASNRRRARFQLPMRHPYTNIQEADICVFAAHGQTWRIFVRRIEEGNNGLLLIDGLVELAATYVHPVLPTEAVGPTPNPPIYIPPFLVTHYIQIPALADALVTFPGFYFVTAPYDPVAEFLGASLREERPDGTFATLFGNVDDAATMGFADTALASGPVGYLDQRSTFDVDFHSGAPASIGIAAAREMAELWLVQDEILAVGTWTPVSGTVYRASNLYRGLRNTEDHRSGHAIGDRVVRLDESVYFTDPQSQPGALIGLKMVPLGSADVDEPTQVVTLDNEMQRPFSPEDIRGTRDGSNNLTVTFRHRSRTLKGLIGDSGGGPDLAEPSESYEVEFPDAVPVRVKTVGATKSVAYTAAEQTTDGLTPGNAVKVRVYQISASVGRGNFQEKNV